MLLNAILFIVSPFHVFRFVFTFSTLHLFRSNLQLCFFESKQGFCPEEPLYEKGRQNNNE